jgi:hypothetical protein
LRDPGIDERIILRWIIRKLYLGVWTAMSYLRIGTQWHALLNVVMNLWVP